jgi:hypothetical protein
MTTNPRPLSAEEEGELRAEFDVAEWCALKSDAAVHLLATLDATRARHAALVEAAGEALGYLDKISPSGWHVEHARAALRAALDKLDARSPA